MVSQIRQSLFRQTCFCSEFIKVATRQCFPLYGIALCLMMSRNIMAAASWGNLAYPSISSTVQRKSLTGENFDELS